MSEAKHTPGPWKWEVDGQNNDILCLVGAEDEIICTASVSCVHSPYDLTHGALYANINFVKDWKTNKANENLIKNAPDMFKICKYTKALLEDNVGQRTHAIAMINAVLDRIEKEKG